MRAQEGEHLYAVAEIGLNSASKGPQSATSSFVTSLRACSHAASASADVPDAMEWGEEFVVGVSRKLAREGVLRLRVELRHGSWSPSQTGGKGPDTAEQHDVLWSANSGLLSIATLKHTGGFRGWIGLADSSLSGGEGRYREPLPSSLQKVCSSMYVCMYICMCVWMHACMHACMHPCM